MMYMQHLHMAKLMGDGECSTQSIILTDAATPVWIAHCSQFCKSWNTNLTLVVLNLLSTSSVVIVYTEQRL